MINKLLLLVVFVLSYTFCFPQNPLGRSLQDVRYYFKKTHPNYSIYVQDLTKDGDYYIGFTSSDLDKPTYMLYFTKGICYKIEETVFIEHLDEYISQINKTGAKRVSTYKWVNGYNYVLLEVNESTFTLTAQSSIINAIFKP